MTKTLFPQRLKELGTALGYSQAKLAKKLNYTSSAIANYESGRNEPSIKDIILLSQILCVSTDYLLGNSNIKNIRPLECCEEDFDMITLLHSLDKPTLHFLLSFASYQCSFTKIKQ